MAGSVHARRSTQPWRPACGSGDHQPSGPRSDGAGFQLSIAQILISVGVCAIVEIAIVFWRTHLVVWPGSALFDRERGGLHPARRGGTKHGDWWSVNGLHLFALTALVAILFYLVRPGGRHIYNPSNLGLVACFLAVGVLNVFPQYLWWGLP